MFSSILLASDGSECARRAAAVAAAFANKFGARLTIINVFHPPLYIAPDGVPGGWEPNVSDIGDDQDAAVCCAGRVVDAQNVPYLRCKEIGIPAAEIVRVAEEEGCDLIVLGSRGLSGMKAFLLGSVSDGVIHHAHCPTLIVK